jgi:tetratricopeptide (TPR) repeat protein
VKVAALWPGVFAFSLLLAQSPDDARSLLGSAIAAEKAGNAPAAVRQFEKLLHANPPAEIAGQARLELLRIHQRREDWWAAAVQLRELRKLAPNDSEYAYELGAVYQNLSKWAFERMQALEPRGARTQQMLGEQYGIAGEREKAIRAFRQAIAADPKLAGSHLALAVIYGQLGKRTEALAEIDQELAIAPQSATARQVRRAITGATP